MTVTPARIRPALSLGLLAVVVLLAAGVAASAAPPRVSAASRGARLTSTSLGGFTHIDQIDALSPRLSYAIATGYLGRGHYAYYLVRTTDLGATWTVQGEIAANLNRYPIFSDFSPSASNSSIDFANARVGYVDGVGGSLDVTNNGGATWQQITSPASTTSYAVDGATTTVVTSTCRGGGQATGQRCTNEFALYPTGSAHPLFSTDLRVMQSSYVPTVGLLAAAPDGIDVINVTSDNITTATSLRISFDSGRTWRTMANPCASLAIEQMLVAPDHSWILSCFLDGGMSQGPGKLLRSTDEGRTWTTEENFPRNRAGSAYRPDTPQSLFFSANGRLLYAVELNPAGGLAVSSDFGRTWTPERFLGNTGGWPGSIANFGPSNSIYQVFQGPAFDTSNGYTWKLLPQLAAGRYRGHSICTPTTTTVRWRTHLVSGLRYSYLLFTNDSRRSCYLSGVPEIQPANSRGEAVGPPLTGESGAAGGGNVVLGPGAVANVSLFLNSVLTYSPIPSCAPAQASQLFVTFAPTSQFKFRLPARAVAVCTATPIVQPGQVTPGRGRP